MSELEKRARGLAEEARRSADGSLAYSLLMDLAKVIDDLLAERRASDTEGIFNRPRTLFDP